MTMTVRKCARTRNGSARSGRFPDTDDPAKTGEVPRYGTAREGRRSNADPVPPHKYDGKQE